MFLTCILFKNIVLTIMDFKFLTLIVERKACYTMVVVIDLMLYSFHLLVGEQGATDMHPTLANGITAVATSVLLARYNRYSIP